MFGSKHPDFNSWKESKNGKAWAEHDTTPYNVLPFKKQFSKEDQPQEHLDEMGKLYHKPICCFNCSNITNSRNEFTKFASLIPANILIHEHVININMLIEIT